LEVGKMRLNKDFGYAFDDPKFMDDIKLHDLPVTDERHKTLDIYEMTIPPKPLDQKAIAAYNDSLVKGLKTSEEEAGRKNLGGFKTEITYKNHFGKEALATVGQRSMMFFDHDRSIRTSFAKEYKDIISDPERLAEHSEAFKEVYGKVPENEREFMAARDILNVKGMTSYEPKIVDDTYGRQVAMENRRFANQKTMEGIRQSNRKAIKAYGAAKNAEERDGILNNMINNQIAEGGQKFSVSHKGKKYQGTSILAPKSIQDKFMVWRKDANGNDVQVPPNTFIITDDKKHFIPVYVETDNKGKRITTREGDASQVVSTETQPYLIQDYKAMLGKELLTKTQMAGELNDDFEDEEEEVVAPSKPKKSNKVGKIDDL
jgi:hypothetical protein